MCFFSSWKVFLYILMHEGVSLAHPYKNVLIRVILSVTCKPKRYIDMCIGRSGNMYIG